MSVPCSTELFNACHILFGTEIDVSLDFLRYLRPSGLKSAYRQKALETHPDRAAISGEDEAKLQENFRKVNLAYEQLRSVIGEKGLIETNISSPPPFYRPASHDMHRSHRKPKSEHFYSGIIPPKKLFIGQFLYYSGIISWQTLIEAIAYQRRKRPIIGQIALGWGILSDMEIKQILKERSFSERFGEYALRKNLITPFDLMALLGKQRTFHCPLGDYFIQKKILRPNDLEQFVQKQQIHNLKIIRSNRK